MMHPLKSGAVPQAQAAMNFDEAAKLLSHIREKCSSFSYSGDFHQSLKDAIARLRRGGQEGSFIADSLIDWIGSDEGGSQPSGIAAMIIQEALEEGVAAQVQAEIVLKLSAARNDQNHPFREMDIGQLFAALPSCFDENLFSVWKRQLENTDDLKKAFTISHIADYLENPFYKPTQAQKDRIAHEFAGEFLKILTRPDINELLSAPGLQSGPYRFAIGALEKLAVHAPSATLGEILENSKVIMKPEADAEPEFPLNAQLASGLLSGPLKKAMEKAGIPAAELIASHISAGEGINVTALNAACSYGESAVEPLMDEAIKRPSLFLFNVLSGFCQTAGPNALDKVIGRIVRGDEKSFMVGSGILAPFLQKVASGSSEPEQILLLAQYERALRDPEFGKRLSTYEESENPVVVEQVGLLRKALKMI